MEKRKYEDIQIIEVFHESKRQKICAYKSLIKENCFEGTQVFEYDEAGNLLKRTVIQNHSGSGQLREAGVSYFVEKNTILRFALKEAGLDGITNVLEGTTAIASSNDDQTAPARILGKFAEDCKDEKFFLKAGYIGEDVYDEAGVKALSKIPSRETLLAQLVGSLQGPIQKLAATLQAVVDKDNEAA